jgi:serine/threonine protein kinase
MNAAVRDSDTLFAQAIEIASPEERALFLEKACANDAALRREVEKLVRDHFRAGAFLERPAAHVVAAHDEPPAEAPGTVLGPYKLLEQIGEGGFGVVFMAEQAQPVRRKVALKILKPGMDTRQVVARFEAERQALALMDHPNIAHVFDGGETASGRPYFVMELVRGIPITDFADENDLPVRPRLELFATVCQAIQHAHHKGIIHRDVKPTNVLVTLHDGTPVVKVIDFGIAKALSQQLTEKTLFTNFAQMIGTPLYMSPEQAAMSGKDVDTRTDIYSLGVLLYELLTGTTPFDKERLDTVGYDELRRIIREEEPPRPSTRISTLGQAAATVSTRRQSDPKRLSRLFRGDLDWIVMKALEKDRDRRYDTASALAADVQRYLADEPVLASPPSLRYRLGRFLRKYRGPVLAASVILLLLVGGIIGTSLGFVRAERQRQIAEENEQTALKEKSNALAAAAAERLAQQNEAAQRQKAEAAQRHAMEALRGTTDDMVEQLIGMKPALGPVERIFLENALKRWQTFAAEKGDGELARAVRAEGVLRVAILRAKLGEHDTALADFREALVLWGKLATDFPAVAQYREFLALSHTTQGNLLSFLGKWTEAEEAYCQALGLLEKLATDCPAWPPYRQQLAASHNDRGTLLTVLGKCAEAEEAFRRALGLQEQLVAQYPVAQRYRADLANCHHNRATLLAGQGKWAEAEEAYGQALAIQEKLATDCPTVPKYRQQLAASYNDRGNFLAGLGKPAESEEAYGQALAIQEKLAAQFPGVPLYRSELANSHYNRATLLVGQRKWPEAEAAYRQALSLVEKLAAQFPAVPQYRHVLASVHIGLSTPLAALDKRADAEDSCRRALGLLEILAVQFPTMPRYRSDLAASHHNRAALLGGQGKCAEAEDACRLALDLLEQLAADFPAVAQYRQHLARSHGLQGTLLAAQRKWPEAEATYRQALGLQEKLAADFPAVPQYRTDLGATQLHFGHLLVKKRQPEPALEWYAKAIATLEGVLRQVKVDPAARRFLRNAHGARADTLDLHLKRHAEALADWDRAVELSPEPEQLQFRMRRALCRVRVGQVDAATEEAEQLAKNANGVTLFAAACVFALAAARPEETGSSLSREACAKRAVALLRQAAAADGKLAEQIKRHDDLLVLRQRDDFKKLLAEMDKKSP